jgi:catechol 2,3-dioxygenase-like lactoylglutathione lyase family enzyme
MKLGYTILYVPDVDAALAFYARAFGLARRFLAPDAQYGELETGDTRLAFAAAAFVRTLIPTPFDDPAPHKPAPPVEIGLTTDDVPAAYAQALAAGATPVKPAETKPWGQTVAYVRDLNGFLVELCTPMP